MCDFDVIIIGGRPAGSTLAAWLGKFKINVLLLERAQFPSLPAASSPIIYAPTMKILDEIGAKEAEYARNTPKIYQLHIEAGGISAEFPIPDDKGRNYAYAVDRARFDHALWEHARTFPTVTAYENFNVLDLICEGGRVCGVIGKDAAGETVRFTSDIVVGADGRFSMVARKVNARVLDEDDRFPTTLYYAYWKNTKPYQRAGVAASVAYEGEPGIGYLVMDSADNTTAVCVEGQADLLNPEAGQADKLYMEKLKALPGLWARLSDAEMVTDVHGMRRIGNLYRQAGGEGWALVGDAYHHKDPLDGQGIYNAVFTAKALAWAIRDWKHGDKSWQEALEWYDETARIKTYAMYKALIDRVQNSFYANPDEMPKWLQERMSRWTLTDDGLKEMFGRMVTRQIPADVMRIMTPPTLMGAMVRGSLRDLREGIRNRIFG